MAKNGRAGHQQMSARGDRGADRLGIHAAIDFEQHVGSDLATELGEFLQRHALKLLAAKAG